MLNLRRDDMIALVAQCEERALQRQVIGFAPAAREYDLVIPTTEQRRDLPACRFKGRFRRGSCPMATRWIAVVSLQKRAHRRNDGRIDRRAGVVVQIDMALCHSRTTGKPASFHCSMPRRRTLTRMKPAA